MKEKEKLLAKLNIKDYKNELELVLDEKQFDEEAKSLILSIFYKLDNFYKDYQLVKNYGATKNDFLENYINIIRKKCKKITISSPQYFKHKEKYIIDREKGEINCFPNEAVLMYAIFDLNEKKEKANKYNLGDFTINCLNYVITNGDVINSIEPLRDFNGWSWNAAIEDPNHIIYNVIYQNLLLLFGYDSVKKCVGKDNILTLLDGMVKSQKYGKRGKNFLNALYEVCIILFNNSSKENHQKCIKYKNSIKNKINMLNARTSFVEEEGKNSNEFGNRIKEIDNILNSRELLMNEFEKATNKDRKKFFSLSELADSLEEEKNKLLNNVTNEKKQTSISSYQKSQEKYNKILKLYNQVTEEKEKVNVQPSLLKLQIAFLECEKLKIPKCTTKRDLYNMVIELRYYANILYKKDKTPTSVSKINEKFKEVSDILTSMLIENKVVDIGFKTKKLNSQILSYMYKTKIIKLENLILKISFDSDKMLEVEYYDANMLDGKETFEIPFDEEIANKKNRKIKLFKIGG